eukprot:Rmarinus@m.16020
MEVFDRMQSLRIQPNQIMYGILIDSHCKAGNVEDALEVFRSMGKSSLQPTPTTYSSLLHACIGGKRFHALPGLLEGCRTHGILLSRATCNSLICLACKLGESETANLVYQYMAGERLRYI